MFEESLNQIFSSLSDVENFKSLEIMSPDNLILNYTTGVSKTFFSTKEKTAAYQILEYIE